MQPHMRVELALEALHTAIGRCLPDAGLVLHSDRGVQYAAVSYQAALDEHNIVCSMSRKGDRWDNAVAESFFGTLKTELINRHRWSTNTLPFRVSMSAGTCSSACSCGAMPGHP